MKTFEEKLIHYTAETCKLGIPVDPKVPNRDRGHVDSQHVWHQGMRVDLDARRWTGGYKLNQFCPKPRQILSLTTPFMELYVLSVLCGERWLTQAYEDGDDPYITIGSKLGLTRDESKKRYFEMHRPSHQGRTYLESICPKIHEFVRLERSEHPFVSLLGKKVVRTDNSSRSQWLFILRTVTAELSWLAFVDAWENKAQIRGVLDSEFFVNGDDVETVRRAWKNVHPKFKIRTQLRYHP